MSALKDLVVSSREINTDLVAEILAPFVRLDADSSDILPTTAWAGLSSETKILLYLLARKAMIALQMSISVEGATPQEIERSTGVIGGTLRPILKRHLGARFVARGQDARYFVPNHAIEAVKMHISERVGR